MASEGAKDYLALLEVMFSVQSAFAFVFSGRRIRGQLDNTVRLILKALLRSTCITRDAKSMALRSCRLFLTILRGSRKIALDTSVCSESHLGLKDCLLHKSGNS